MNWGYLLAVAVVFGGVLILSQRMTSGVRRGFRIFIVAMAILLMIRYEYHLENVLGYLAALVISFMFWLLIGRYNQIDEDNQIKVFGLDD